MKNNNYEFSRYLIETYSGFGIKHAFVSPGSRNTPLMLALSDQSKIKVTNVIDERVSGFMALGTAMHSKSPAIVVTTSGSALANLFPSIIESYMSNIPMIIITADRPKTLINTGANQTIYQNEFFGKYVHKFFDITVKKRNNSEAIKIAKDSILDSINFKSPIHINMHFDVPLHHIRKNDFKYDVNQSVFIKNKVNKNIEIPNFNNYKKPIIICTNNDDIEIVKSLEKYKIPIFMESIGARFQIKSKNLISNYHFILDNQSVNPDLIIRFGKKPISNILNDFIDQNKSLSYLVTSKHFNDDSVNVIETSNENFLSKFCTQKLHFSERWFNKIISYNKNIQKSLEDFFSKPKEHEGYIINKILDKIPINSNLFIGNSSPVRDLDQYTFNCSKSINVFSNRGASGIDGLISTSMGISIDSNKHNFAIIGDMSFFYDMSALINAQKVNNLTIIVLNNSGGHIFDRLKGISSEKDYKKLWLNPITLDLKNISISFECNYELIDYSELEKLNFSKNLSKKIKIIEIRVDSQKHKKNNQEIFKIIGNL